MARQMQSIARHNQYKSLGERGSAGYFYRRSRNGQVADQAIDGVAAKLNHSHFQDVVTRCSAIFGHRADLGQNPEESVKHPKKGHT
jgi:hypothetical protein